MRNLLTSVELCGSYGLYKVTMDLAVCYEFKSGFADDKVISSTDPFSKGRVRGKYFKCSCKVKFRTYQHA